MPHHNWSDKRFDWKALGQAIKTCDWICSKIGRIGMHSKEKYGTFRNTAYFFNGELHSLIYPGYAYNQFPDWLWKLDIYVSPKLFKYTGLTWLINRYQRLVYGFAYWYVMQKHFHIVDEIACDMQNPEFVPGGQKLHDKMWTRIGDKDGR